MLPIWIRPNVYSDLYSIFTRQIKKNTFGDSEAIRKPCCTTVYALIFTFEHLSDPPPPPPQYLT